MKKKLQCQCCSYTTKSEQMLRKHRYTHHPKLNMKSGRPKKSVKKSRLDINRDYRQRKVLQPSTATSATTNTLPKPAARKPKKRPIGFTKAEPLDQIGAFSWLPVLSHSEALAIMKQKYFWQDCIKHNLDPLWAYRYLSWRLHHPKFAEVLLLNDIPGVSLPVRVITEHL